MKNRTEKRKKAKIINKVIMVVVAMLILLAILGFVQLKNGISAEDVTINVGEIYNYRKIEAVVNEKKIDVSKLFEAYGKIDFGKAGNYKIKYFSKIPGIKDYERNVIIKDTQSPSIVLSGETELTLENIDDFVEPGFIAVDNVDGDITENVNTVIRMQSKILYSVEYSVQDTSGNLTRVNRVINIKKGTIYLTFDDGPSSTITSKILDVLEENNVKATFFVVGFSEDRNEILQRMSNAGHTIGFHGLSHEYGEIYSSIDNLMENFHKIEKDVIEVTEKASSKIVRFPGGSSNTISKRYSIGIMSEATKKVLEEGYTYFDWNVDSQDAGGAKNADEVFENVISGLKSGRENIVLMHDSAGHTATLEALPRIIKFCREEGYEFNNITEETIPVVHPVAN